MESGPRYLRAVVAGLAVLLVAVGGAGRCGAQAVMSSAAKSALPDAPSVDEAGSAQMRPVSGERPPTAARYTKYIDADQQAVPFAVLDKMKFGLHDAFSLQSFEVWTLAAGYEQLINTSPNYGQNADGFGKRLGAAAVRDSSETLLVDSVFAPMFHEDPRYYKVGNRRGIAYRTLYAVTRPLITRTDSGGTAPNVALLAGDLSGTVLTNAYYPQINRGFKETGKSFGWSLGAIASGNVFHEFVGDALEAWRAKREK